MNYAKSFATLAHKGQYRKFTKEPYINHPIRVARIVEEYYPENREMVAAAYLHDVVEDTDTTIEILEEIFGKEVALIVNSLTSTGNIDLYFGYINSFNESFKTKIYAVKAADILDNVRDITRCFQKGFVSFEVYYKFLIKKAYQLASLRADCAGLADSRPFAISSQAKEILTKYLNWK